MRLILKLKGETGNDRKTIQLKGVTIGPGVIVMTAFNVKKDFGSGNTNVGGACRDRRSKKQQRKKNTQKKKKKHT